MADIKMSIQEANALRSSNDLLGDFSGTVKVPLIKATVQTDNLFQILTYVQDGLDSKTVTVNGVEIKMSVKGTAAKVYIADVEVSGQAKKFWIDYFASYKELYSYITSENFVEYSADEIAKLTSKVNVNGTEYNRIPSTAEGATNVTYGYVLVPMSRLGRVVKVGTSSVVGGTATKVVKLGEKVYADKAAVEADENLTGKQQKELLAQFA